jgi:hypothetical protein
MQQLTRKIAWAAALDAASRSMRNNLREAWNEDDYNACVAEFDRLWPEERDIQECKRLAAMEE